MSEKGVTQYKLNKRVELRAKKLIEIGFHNTVSDLVEYAVMKHVLDMEHNLQGTRK